MRALNEYDIGEWVRGTPLVHGFKRGRNAVVERAFRRIGARRGDMLISQRPELAGKTIVAVIAFNAPWTVELMLRSASRLRDCAFIIFDNSREVDARREIERICLDRDTAYLPLPFNPERHACRSHGLAMTWAYYNVIEPLQPRVFAYFDHDLIPTESYNLASKVAKQPVYGVLNESRWGWNLWAGFSVFDFLAVRGFRPDFNHDVPRHLDTGGCNWQRVYRYLDRSSICFAKLEPATFNDPMTQLPVVTQTVDGALLHIGGVGHRLRGKQRVRPAFFQDIVEALEHGATLAQLHVPQQNGSKVCQPEEPQ